MSNSIVSVRVPESMVKELKGVISNDHYLDLSEAVRGIVRKKWVEWRDPETFQIKQLRSDIKDVVKEQSKKSKQEHLLEELERIKEMISSQGDPK